MFHMQFAKSSIIFIILFFVVISVDETHVESKPIQEMKVHFIDVGQGDSILIQTTNGKNILIDGGPPKAGKAVVKFLKHHNVKKINLLIATHPDIDHIGGLPAVMKEFDVARVIDSGKLHTTRTYARYIRQIRKQEIPVEIAQLNQQIYIDPNVNIKILNTYGQHKNNNQSSIVLKVTYNEVDFLLMGDSEHQQERQLMKQHNLQSEIFKVGHHGSKTGTILPFVQSVKPKVAIITYGKDNDYGHPVHRVIRNLQKVNTNIYSTAVFGNITILTDGDEYFVLTEKTPLDVFSAYAS